MGQIFRPSPDGHCKIVGEAFADFGTGLARDREQLCLVVTGKIACEIGVPVLDYGPFRSSDWPTQFNRGRPPAHGQFLGGAAQGGYLSLVLRENSAADRKAAGDQRPSEQR